MGLRTLWNALFSRPSRFESVNYLFFGLGNPGEQYRTTRHNIGFMIIDAFSERLQNRSHGSAYNADFSKGIISPDIVSMAIKPYTFMNRSGETVGAYLKKANLPSSSCLVIVDDFNIPLGTIRIRRNGSAGGHNGLKSVISHIGSDFPRMRVGIGPLPEGMNVIDYVLGNFSKNENERLQTIIPHAVDALGAFANDGVDVAMNQFNR
jgi:peptidyl-tRNA hydrolase, PTH1 family